MPPKNNLKEHIRWLLDTKPVVPGYITPPSSAFRSSFDGSESLDAYVTANEGDASAERRGATTRPEDATRIAQWMQRDLERTAEEPAAGVMARLTTAPGSSRKPSLIQNERQSIATPDRSSSHRQRLQSSKKAVETISQHEGLATPVSLSAEQQNLVIQDDDELERLFDDLQEPQQQLSSSSLEGYGEPQLLWTEKHASQHAPTARSGKKRKSSEMTDGTRGNETLSRKSMVVFDVDEDDLAPINLYDIDDHRQESGVSSTPSRPKKRHSPGLKSSKNEVQFIRPSQAPEEQRIEEEKRSVISNEDVLQISSQYTGPAISRKPSPSKVTSQTHSGQVLDSDDEEILSPSKGAGSARVKPHTQVKGSPLASDTKISNSQISKKDNQNAGGNVVGSESLASAYPERAILVSQQPVNASPFHSDSPTKVDNVIPRSSKSLDAVPATPAPNKNPAVQSLLRIDRERLGSYAEALQHQLEERLDAVWFSEEAGEMDDNAHEIAKALRDEITCFNEMLSMWDEYATLSVKAMKHQAEFKRAFMAGQAVNPRSFRPPEVERMRTVEIETILSNLIGKVQRILRLRLNTDLYNEKEQPKMPANVSVLRTPPKPRLPTTQILRSPTAATRELVAQTQSFGEVLSTPRRDKDSLNKREASLSTSSQLPQADNAEARQPLRRLRETEVALNNGYFLQNPSRKSINNDKSLKFPPGSGTENYRSDDVPIGSPMRPVDVDESPEEDFSYGDFGHDDDDDEDMLDCLADFENRRKMTPRNVAVRTPNQRSTIKDQQRTQERTRTLAAPGKASEPAKNLMSHSWSKDVKNALVYRFGLQGFRHNQLEAVNATLGGKDTFVLMPTGGGKSLCYQLPAVVNSGRTKGVTIVVSPLLSLMQDQVQHLQAIEIQAWLINGETPPEIKQKLMSALRSPDPARFVQLLYVTPEMLSKNKMMIELFKSLYARQVVARIVVDEAHCVSQWGHDFRPDYQCIGEFRRELPDVPVMALTATATENVKMDVIQNLGMSNCEIFSQSFNRPNLYYEVHKKETGMVQRIAELIKDRHHRQCGIIYCLSRKNCENIAEKLRDQYRIRAAHYHAGMKPEEKLETQLNWQKGSCDVIVATIAFGMGIDKPNVRYVIHHSVPKSLEGYYQETGRAGRDGKPSNCYLFYSFRDVTTLDKMIREDANSSMEQKERQLAMLREVNRFCDNRADCRRMQILGYFNERFTPDECNKSCDNCNSTSSFERQDFTAIAKAAVEMVKKIAIQGCDFTKHQCVDLLRGSGGKKSRRAEAETRGAPNIGLAKNFDKGTIERLFNHLITDGALKEVHLVNGMKFPITYIGPGEHAGEYIHRNKQVEMDVHVSPQAQRKTKPKKTESKEDSGDDSEVPRGLKGVNRRQPTSTMLSSPINSRGKQRRGNTEAPHQPENKKRAKVISVIADEDSDSDFEPVRDIRKPKARRRTPELGPPIIEDPTLAGLDSAQRLVLDQGIEGFKRRARDIMVEKNLRKMPFTETQLREMIIRLPKSQKEMLQIPGIREDMVINNGHAFMDLIGSAREILHAMRALHAESAFEGEEQASDGENSSVSSDDDEDDGKIHDKNHDIEVVMIDSDDDEEGPSAVPEYDLDEMSAGQTSEYFRQAPDVRAFNAQMSQAVPSNNHPAIAKPKYKPRKAGVKAKAGGFRKSSANFKASKARSRSTSGSIGKGRAGSKASSSSKRGNRSAPTGQLDQFMNTSGISMMPT